MDLLKINFKPLVISLIAQLVLTSLMHLKITTPEFLQFLNLAQAAKTQNLLTPESVDSQFFTQIMPKLQRPMTNFKIQKQSSLISSVMAGSLYDFDQADSYLVINLKTGDILAEKDSLKKLPIASLTKVMTAVVALDLASPEETFIVSQAAAEMIPTKIGVVYSQNMSLEELLEASLLTSANDATEVIKQGIDQKYQQEIFVKAMNAKALVLDMKDTHFDNPQGFDGDGYSSAQDLAILSQYALLKYPLIKNIVSKQYQLLPADINHKQFDLFNWNGLLGVYPGTFGIKIGNTGLAKYTTIVASEREGEEVLAILLGAPGVLERDLWTAKLLNLGFKKLGMEEINLTENQLKQKYASWKYWK